MEELNNNNSEDVHEENKEPLFDGNFFTEFIEDLKQFLHSVTSIKEEVNVQMAVHNIKKGIDFSGSSVWILVCSIIVASIGLNANSVAVIIGAMLISPLMGPIRGFGLALATNDMKTLISSLVNFGVMVAVSLIASWAYFWLTPLKEITPELVARTQPQVLDVLVAFFGGLAGIIAAVSTNRSAALTVIPGVAIATALMPPLCTAGFGLATHNWDFFFGAFYLFTLNSVFIGLSTIVTVWMLGFPMVQMLDKEREKRVKWTISIFLLLIIIPSIIGFINIINESIFYRETKDYIAFLEKHNSDVNITPKINYNEGNPEVTLWVQGPYLNDKEINFWKSIKKDYNLNDVDVKIKQQEYPHTYIDTNSIRLQTMYESKLSALNSIEEERDYLKSELIRLQNPKLNFLELERRLKLSFPNLQELIYGEDALLTRFSGNIDTVYLFAVKWNNQQMDSIAKVENSNKLKESLRLELQLKNLVDSTADNRIKLIELN